MYHGPNGLKCAIGTLINDDAYSVTLETLPAENINVRAAVEKSLSIKLSENEARFLQVLQNIHDNSEPNKWSARLMSVKKKYKIE
jgi:hypothetical protein